MLFKQLASLIASAGSVEATSATIYDGIASGPLHDRLHHARADLRHANGTLFAHRVRDLQKQAVIDSEVFDGALQPTYSVIAALLDGGGASRLYGFEHTMLWQAAIRAALDYNAAFPVVYIGEGRYELPNGRMYNVARSVSAGIR